MLAVISATGVQCLGPGVEVTLNSAGLASEHPTLHLDSDLHFATLHALLGSADKKI